MNTTARVAGFLLAFFLVATVAGAADTVFGPETISVSAKKAKVAETFTALQQARGTLHIVNGVKGSRAKSVKIVLNGKRIITKKQVNSEVRKYSAPVVLQDNNSIKIIVKGSGAGVKVTIKTDLRDVFDTVAGIGDSLTAGMVDGTLVAEGQKMSYAAQIAASGDYTFTLPLISEPGIPPRQIKIENGLLVFLNPQGLGRRTNPGQKAYNLAVPGADINDVLNTKKSLWNPLYSIILGGNRTMLEETLQRKPSFVFFWIGSNDVLGMALDTDPDRHSDLDEFEENYEEILDELTSNNIRVVTANLVDVTQIAYLIPPPSENLGIPDTHRVALTVLLDILQGKSPSLTADDILTPAEMKQIRTTVEKFNGVIERLCKEHDVPVFDAWSFMDDAYKNGYDVGSTTLTTEMFGGIFSLDGIHPTYTAQAVIANGFIEILNGKFGQGVVDIDVESVLANDPNKPTDAAPAALLDARSARALEESIKNLREILLKR